MLRNMKICRVLLYLRSLSKNCLVFVFPESTVSWTGKNWKSYSVLQRQGKCQVSGQTWGVSILLAPWAACRPWWGSFHWENEVSFLHQCHEWCEDECIYVHCLFPLSSVQFSCSLLSDSLRPHEPQYARPSCPSPTPRVHPNLCPLCRWCHPTISSSVILFSYCFQSFPASGSFQMSQLSTSGGQSIGVSASTSVPPMNTQDWSPLGWTGWISLQSKELSRVFSNTTVQKHQFFSAQLSLQSKSHIHTWLW